jgi:putative N6-adenine-specific DNA methylase
MFEYQKYGRFFAQVAGKMESLCEEELRELGARNTRAVYRGVSFEADHAALYRINYMSRLTTRVLAPLLTFSCHSTRYLKKTAASIAWEQLLSLDRTFAITASVSNSGITHSRYAALCLKDGIADYFTAKYGKRPNVDIKNPDVRFNLHIDRNKAVVSLDVSGESLHKRGYRLVPGEAPMPETLAAALIRLSGWNGERPLWDCMCGSGTILCEALMHYCRLPAQHLRKTFGFCNLPDFDRKLWGEIRTELAKAVRPLPKGLLSGSDRSKKALAVARRNLSHLPFNESIRLSCAPFSEAPHEDNTIIVCNPPYGIRLGARGEVAELYRAFGDFLKKKCCGTSAYIYIGDTSLRTAFGLKPSWRVPLANGKIEGEMLRIDSYRIAFRKRAAPKKTDAQ